LLPLWSFVACSMANFTFTFKVKVKCTLVQALRLCTDRTARRGSRGIALPFHEHGTRKGLGVSVTPRPLFTSGKDPVPIVQEAGWAPGLVWTGAENLAPTGIRSPDRPTRSQSLHRRRYPAHTFTFTFTEIAVRTAGRPSLSGVTTSLPNPKQQFSLFLCDF